ncbi:MAG: VCBS repeat-containing protein [Candidatus Aminicenantes bacterium]|nr:VCBS repeat-containing protein [Candidatus Aminicenantes bacterium]
MKRQLFSIVLCLFLISFLSCSNNPNSETTNGSGTDTDSEPQDEYFIEHTVDLNFAGIHCIKMIDLDGDGDLDIVGGSETTPYSQSQGLAWWRNNGGDPPAWTRYVIDAGFDHVMSVDVYDIDGDSLLDIAATSWSLHQIAWWKNSGNVTSGWTRLIILANFINAHDAKCFDIDGDGTTDIAGICSGGDVAVCANDGSPSPNWNTTYPDRTFYGGKTILIHDLNGNGKPDLIATASDADRVTWWENQPGNPTPWPQHDVDPYFIGGSGISITDMNGDGVTDIVGTSWKNNVVAYWICQDLANDQWQKTVVTYQLEVAVNAFGCDMDLDGDIDIVAVGKDPGELAVFYNDNFTWTEHTIKSGFEGGSALSVIDLDNDGDFDIIAGASALGDLLWWENKTNT